MHIVTPVAYSRRDHFDLEAQDSTVPPASISPIISKDKAEVSVGAAPVVPELLQQDNSQHELPDPVVAQRSQYSFDVDIHNLSIAVPPFRAEIPTPIPIPIPRIVTDALRKWRHGTDTRDAGDSLILRDVNATIRRGELMAVIGGSGSGKTTLLHAIAARLGDLSIAQGRVSIVPSSGDMASPSGGGSRDVVGFVRQNDYLLPHLTVRETLTYAARLRLPSSVDARTRSRIVAHTIWELGLSEVADTVIAGSGRAGISGGERRRLSIGCVLVSFPSVLVLDEVTTGLDSCTAFQLIETLDRLAKRGRTIVLSLHQPRSDAFPLFSRILLLARGSVVYSGKTEACLPYFARLGYQPHEQTNPLDFVIDISSVDTRDEPLEEESLERIARLVQCWRECEDKAKDTEMNGSEEKTAMSSPIEATSTPPLDAAQRRPSAIEQTWILLPRAVQNVLRGYTELVGHLLQGIILGVVLGLDFYQLKGQPNDIQSLKTVTFQVPFVFTYVTQVVWIWKWCANLVVFDREREDGLYGPGPWLLAELLAWLPINVVSPLVFCVLTYFMCNLRNDDLSYNFGLYAIVMILLQQCLVAWSLFAASVERSYARASLIGNSLAVFFILSPGFFLVDVPGWIRWFRWISPHFFSFRILALSQFRGRIFACEGITGPPLQRTGDAVLASMRITASQPLWPMFLGPTGFLVVVLALSWALLTVWQPGGVRHASRYGTDDARRRGVTRSDIDIVRTRVDVVVEDVRMTHVRRAFPSLRRVETPILSGVSARFSSGELSVIMGPSGSGKSTFLRMCTGRALKAGVVGALVPKGRVLFNGVSVSPKTRHVCAFVEQDDDHHLPALTVRETLRFAALIKLPSSVSKERKLARVEEVLKMLGLKECADGLVGGELLKGISGGERRRLSLACEMINDPAVLILDEPTSGLDANTAQNIVEVLHNIARSGRTVIATLHQPRSDIFNMADNFTIFAKKGDVIYHGPREQLLPHFARAGYECPPLYNPPDFFMDLVAIDVRSEESYEKSVARVDALVFDWKHHEDHRKFAGGDLGSDEHATLTLEAAPGYTPMYVAVPVLLDRMLRNTWRQQDIFWTRWLQAPILAICLYIFYLRLPKGPTGAQDRIGLIAQCSSSLTFVGVLNLVAIYPAEKTSFFHDFRSSGHRYSTTSFVLAFSLFAFVPEFVSALVFAVIMNVATGMQTNARIYFEFVLGIWMQLSFGESMGIAFASFFDTMGLAIPMVSVLLSIAAQSSSVFSASVVGFLQDIAWVFPMKYVAQVMTINEMAGLRFECGEESVRSGECTAVDGQQVLDLYGFHEEVWRLMVVGIAVTVGYRVIAWAVLILRMHYV